MNAITLNFADATGGLFTDAVAFFAADEATQARALAAWRAHDAAFAASFPHHETREWMTNDAVGRVFLTPQLYRIETETYMRKYPSYDFASLLTVNEDGDMWDVGTVFYSMDQVGRAEFMSGKAFDMPYASVTMDQFTHGYHLMALGYEWTTPELERAARLGRSLSSDKAMAVDKAVQATLFSLAMTGFLPGDTQSVKGWTGLINNAAVPAAQVANDGTGSSRLWTAKTADLILRDVNATLEAVETGTRETHVANTLLMPTTARQFLSRTRIGDTTQTIMAFIQANNAYTGATGQPLTIRSSRVLETAGTGGTRRMVAYDNSPEVVRFHLPGRHQFLDPLRKGSMTWEVGGIMNVGGTEIRLPVAIAYRDSF